MDWFAIAQKGIWIYTLIGIIVITPLSVSGLMNLIDSYALIDSGTDCSIMQNPFVCELQKHMTWLGLQILAYITITVVIVFSMGPLIINELKKKKAGKQAVAW